MSLKNSLWTVATIALVAMIITPKPWNDLAMIVALVTASLSIGMEWNQRRSAK